MDAMKLLRRCGDTASGLYHSRLYPESHDRNYHKMVHNIKYFLCGILKLLLFASPANRSGKVLQFSYLPATLMETWPMK